MSVFDSALQSILNDANIGIIAVHVNGTIKVHQLTRTEIFEMFGNEYEGHEPIYLARKADLETIEIEQDDLLTINSTSYYVQSIKHNSPESILILSKSQ